MVANKNSNNHAGYSSLNNNVLVAHNEHSTTMVAHRRNNKYVVHPFTENLKCDNLEVVQEKKYQSWILLIVHSMNFTFVIFERLTIEEA